ncbi:MAG: cation diffusion facilitator family transporter [Acidiferrobacterales bacterium]
MNNGAGPQLLDNTDPARYQASRRVTCVSLATNAILAFGQVVIGFVGRSLGLTADGFHTLSDVTTDTMVLFALAHGSKAADEEHPYGHARIETAATVALGVVLILVAIGIAVRAGLRLLSGTVFPPPSALTLWASGLTILVKEGLYRYTERTARRYSSKLLHANAWHHRSDAISSIIVFIGIAATIGGVHYMDSLAAIGVALFVGKVGIDLGWPAINELIDTGLESDQLQRIRDAILGVSGVKTLHLLRTRRLGGRGLVDVHLIVDESISVSEGHQISEAVRAKLIGEIDGIADVMVHIDPEDDTARTPPSALPLRDQVLVRLNRYFEHIEAASRIERIILHYLDGRICVELVIPLSAASNCTEAAALAKQLQESAKQDPDISRVVVYFH